MTTPTPSSDTPQGPSIPTAENTGQAAESNASAQLQDQTRSLAQAITDVASESDPNRAVFVKGVVTAIVNPGTPPTVSVQLAGDTSQSIASVRFIDSYSPVVGDTVIILKQGSELTIFGQMNDASTVAENGWTAPALGSGFTTVALDPVMYRMVVDHGTNKIQWRGQVTVSGSPTAFLGTALPSANRPIGNRPVLLARPDAALSNAAILTANADGTMTLSGGTAAITTVALANTVVDVATGGAGTTGATAHGTLDANIQHTHFSSDGPNPATPSSWTSGINTGSQVHYHNASSHTHSVGSHDHVVTTHGHVVTPTQVAYPTALSLNGVEYFL